VGEGGERRSPHTLPAEMQSSAASLESSLAVPVLNIEELSFYVSAQER
jgi:hypothetical protein